MCFPCSTRYFRLTPSGKSVIIFPTVTTPSRTSRQSCIVNYAKIIGSCQEKVQRDFEKPSFEEKTRFLARILDMGEIIMENRIETSISEDFLIIANPISGKGKSKVIAEKAHKQLINNGREGRVALTTRQGDAHHLAQEAIGNGCRWLIACGGDGTVHEIVNAIAARSDVVLGLIPCGRGNDFARAIGIPKDPDRAIQALLSGKPLQVDVGKIGNLYFDTIVTCGYDAEVSRRASEANVPFSGTATYVYTAITTLFSYNAPIARLEGDFGVYEGEILLAATGITPQYGGGFKIVPDAVMNDGLFDVCIIEPVSRLTVLSMLIKLFWGGHRDHPAVSFKRTKSLTIQTDPPTLLYADGEKVGYTPATVELVERGLTVLVPAGQCAES